MAKSALISSSAFFGLLLLVLIAFISEQGGGVRGESCIGSPKAFGSRTQPEDSCEGCDAYCKELAFPENFRYSGVKQGTCSKSSPSRGPTIYFCVYCVVDAVGSRMSS